MAGLVTPAAESEATDEVAQEIAALLRKRGLG
jgi:hypothetical protein